MKKKFFLPAVLLAVLCCAAGETPRQIEMRLQKSSAGLPEFRVSADVFGIVRTVKSVAAGKKSGGVFKLSLLAAYPQISVLDISDVDVIDLTGIEKFTSLRFLRLGAKEVKGIERLAHPALVRLDLSGTALKDISWIRKCPGVRILHLPESVKDLRPLRGRKFRALSVPGVLNSDDVCRTLGISVMIRTARAYRRPLRETLPPLALQRDGEGKVTGAAFMRFTPRSRALPGILGEMFPEELRGAPVPPKPEEYPGLEKFTRTVPLKAAVFLKDRATLKKLDLRALGAVEFNGEEFPELQELRLSHVVMGLETLKAPKLKRLYLENIEGAVPGGEVPMPPFRYFGREHESRAGAVPVRLGAAWQLDLLKIVPRRNEFDFGSLKNVAVKNLEIRYFGSSLAFLKGKKIYKLSLYAPNVTGKETAVLGTLPLRELNAALEPGSDLAFLKRLKLRRLTLSGVGKKFSAALLKKMPLETLRLKIDPAVRSDIHLLQAPRLKELVLDQVRFTDASFIGRSPQLKSLALENCTFAPAGLTPKEPDIAYVCGDRIAKEILKLKGLKNLRIGQLGVFTLGPVTANNDFPWERFRQLKMENLSVFAERGDFAREFKHLKRLKIDDMSRHGIAPVQVRAGTLLEVLVLTNARPRPDRAVPEPRSRFRRPVMPEPRPEPGVAKRVYIDAPGGFNGGFLL